MVKPQSSEQGRVGRSRTELARRRQLPVIGEHDADVQRLEQRARGLAQETPDRRLLCEFHEPHVSKLTPVE